MAHSRTAKKRIRQAEVSNAYNRWRLRTMRSAIKDFGEQILHGTSDSARKAFAECVKAIDKAAQRGVLHRNQASRRKSRLNTMLKSKVKAAR